MSHITYTNKGAAIKGRSFIKGNLTLGFNSSSLIFEPIDEKESLQAKQDLYSSFETKEAELKYGHLVLQDDPSTMSVG